MFTCPQCGTQWSGILVRVLTGVLLFSASIVWAVYLHGTTWKLILMVVGSLAGINTVATAIWEAQMAEETQQSRDR